MIHPRRSPLLRISVVALLVAPATATPQAKGPAERPTPFPWPDGRRAALSLTFDDARESQVDVGIPLLSAQGVRATFYVQPEGVRKRLAGWKAALAAGTKSATIRSPIPARATSPSRARTRSRTTRSNASSAT
jgi:hypothetical protein